MFQVYGPNFWLSDYKLLYSTHIITKIYHNFLPSKAPKKSKMPERPGASPPGPPTGVATGPHAELGWHPQHYKRSGAAASIWRLSLKDPQNSSKYLFWLPSQVFYLNYNLRKLLILWLQVQSNFVNFIDMLLFASLERIFFVCLLLFYFRFGPFQTASQSRHLSYLVNLYCNTYLFLLDRKVL